MYKYLQVPRIIGSCIENPGTIVELFCLSSGAGVNYALGFYVYLSSVEGPLVFAVASQTGYF